MEPPRTLLTTNTVNTRPAIGKLLMKLSFRIPLMYVAKRKLDEQMILKQSPQMLKKYLLIH
jgi:hypothetical protein